MKQCFKCKATKPLTDFYKHPQMTDGHLGKCKACCIADNVANEQKKSKDPFWLSRERQRHRLKQAFYRATGKAKPVSRESRRRWEKQNRIKKRAQCKAQRAFSRGLLIRPAACEHCHIPNVPLHKHHADYSKPLEIVWLCYACHGKQHRKPITGLIVTNSQSKQQLVFGMTMTRV